MDERARLLAEIEQRQERLTLLLQAEENNLEGIRQLKELSIDAKVQEFDRLYEFVLQYLKYMVEKGYAPKDGEHYIYEMAVECTAGHGAWDIINSC